jgi:hypothetical protein
MELKTRIRRLLDLDFLDKGSSVILIGNPGTGKTFLAKIIAWRACQANRRVLFTTAMDMLNKLLASQVDHSLVRKLKTYTERSTVITTNTAFSEWGNIGLQHHHRYRHRRAPGRELRSPPARGRQSTQEQQKIRLRRPSSRHPSMRRAVMTSRSRSLPGKPTTALAVTGGER